MPDENSNKSVIIEEGFAAIDARIAAYLLYESIERDRVLKEAQNARKAHRKEIQKFVRQKVWDEYYEMRTATPEKQELLIAKKRSFQQLVDLVGYNAGYQINFIDVLEAEENDGVNTEPEDRAYRFGIDAAMQGEPETFLEEYYSAATANGQEALRGYRFMHEQIKLGQSLVAELREEHQEPDAPDPEAAANNNDEPDAPDPEDEDREASTKDAAEKVRKKRASRKGKPKDGEAATLH